MPPAAGSRVRRPDGGKNAGTRRRQPRELTAAQIKMRQDTLTQMGWIDRLGIQDTIDIDLGYEEDIGAQASPELGGDYEETEKRRPAKKRRTAKASLSPASACSRDGQTEALLPTRSHSSPGPLNAVEKILETFEQPPFLEQSGEPQPNPTPQVLDDKVLMPPPFLPQTPSRRSTRTYVPSSQSPDVTPLSLRTTKTARQTQRSPLKDKSANASVSRSSGFIKPPNPFQRFAKVEIPNSGAAEDLDDAFCAQGQSKNPTKNVPYLQLDDQKTPRPRRTTALEDSRDLHVKAKFSRTEHSDSACDPTSGSDSKSRGRLPVPFSQASTQDPTQHDSDPPLPVLPASNSNTYSQPVVLDSEPTTAPARVSVSQATTQPPSQFQRPKSQPRILETVEISDDDEPPEKVQVRSSQATTVAPSSNPASDDANQFEPQPKRRKVSRSKQRPGTPARAKPVQESLPDSLTTSQALDGWEWDGKDWTESQMLPPSLMNFTLPEMLPPAGSQASMTSLDGDDAAVLPKSQRPDTVLSPANAARLKRSDSEGRERPRTSYHKGEKHHRSPIRATNRKIKKEPNR